MYNVGITDIKGASKIYPRVYRLWEHILRRCYSNNSLEKRPSYQNTVVCDRWLIFSNFLNDIKFVPGFDYWWQNPNCQISLDKDILGDGTIYSLNTCVFVPKSFNSKICRLTYGNDTLIKNSKGFVKPIIMFTIDMYPMGVYISISDCARINNLSATNICRVCKGQRQTHKGFRFRYLESYFSIM